MKKPDAALILHREESCTFYDPEQYFKYIRPVQKGRA